MHKHYQICQRQRGKVVKRRNNASTYTKRHFVAVIGVAKWRYFVASLYRRALRSKSTLPSSIKWRTSSPNSVFCQANHGRVYRSGLSLWNDSCISPVPASVRISISRQRKISAETPTPLLKQASQEPRLRVLYFGDNSPFPVLNLCYFLQFLHICRFFNTFFNESYYICSCKIHSEIE